MRLCSPRRRAGVAPALGAALALLAVAPAAQAAPPGRAAQPGPSAVSAHPATPARAQASQAARRARLPGRFVVRGRPLAKRRRVIAGRSISVFARPAAVAVEGCRSRSARVRLRSGRALVSVTARCRGIRGRLRIRGTIRGATLRGTASRGRRVRRFQARLRAPRGALLRGRRSRRALRAVRDTDFLARHSGNEVSRGRGGVQIARTELDLRVKANATVGRVNAALRSVGGRIAGSLENSPRLVVAIPDPGSLAALDKLIARLRRRPGVQSVARAEMIVNFVLPPNLGSPLPGDRATALSHLLALRAPAAWNARRAIQLTQRPTLIVSDKFGDGALSPHVDASCPGCVLGSGDPEPASHGYHVLGIAAASFANDNTPRGLVTGVFPATTRLKVVDLNDQTDGAGVTRTLQAAKDTAGRVVLNTSWGHSEVSDRDSRVEGNTWASAVRTAGLTGRMLHAAAAGNEARPAELFSEWNAAALRRDLSAPDGSSATPLPNTLITENLVDSGAPAFEPGCRGLGSNTGGQLAAVGTDVFSHIKRREGSPALVPAGAGDLTGTSQASPQVAALAEYVWSIAPDLTPSQIAALLIDTARPPFACPPPGPGLAASTSAPRLDAYAAVLSLDQTATVTPAGAPVRRAILDHNDSGSFDEADLAAHAAAIAASSQGRRDWGRSDLNGDGFTGVGGTTPAPFDLDRTGSTRAGVSSLGTVTQSIEGATVSFNENQVSDLEVLCYYAYSGIYTGSTAQREALLTSDLKGCGHPLTVAPPGATLAPGESAQFSAKVANVTDGTVAWATTGGGISASGRYTAPSTPGTYVVAATDVTDPTRSATATVTVLDPAVGGKYDGTSTLCETEPIFECFDPEETKALLEVSGNDFTLYFRSEGMGFGTSYPTADCDSQPSGPTCAKYTGTRSGSAYSGVESGSGTNPDFARTIDATISGDTFSGRIDDPPDGNGDFIEFSLIHDPD